jgi:hypothetical protein
MLRPTFLQMSSVSMIALAARAALGKAAPLKIDKTPSQAALCGSAEGTREISRFAKAINDFSLYCFQIG